MVPNNSPKTTTKSQYFGHEVQTFEPPKNDFKIAVTKVQRQNQIKQKIREISEEEIKIKRNPKKAVPKIFYGTRTHRQIKQIVKV